MVAQSHTSAGASGSLRALDPMADTPMVTKCTLHVAWGLPPCVRPVPIHRWWSPASWGYTALYGISRSSPSLEARGVSRHPGKNAHGLTYATRGRTLLDTPPRSVPESALSRSSAPFVLQNVEMSRTRNAGQRFGADHVGRECILRPAAGAAASLIE